MPAGGTHGDINQNTINFGLKIRPGVIKGFEITRKTRFLSIKMTSDDFVTFSNVGVFKDKYFKIQFYNILK